MADILVIDDDVMITTLISDSLTDEGFTVKVLHDGQSALNELAENSFRLITLDIMMPNVDGLQVCRMIRDKTKCPIIFITAKSSTVDTIVGLEIGGDDYITKPFVVEELTAKVKAHIRRDKRKFPEESNAPARILGDLRIYPDNYEVFNGENRIDLSTREFQLLMYLIDNIGRVLTREQIFDAIWGLDYSDIGTVTVTIKNLRDKIDPDNQIIKTVWGIGYKLVKPTGGEK